MGIRDEITYGVPEVDIAAADSCALYIEQDFAFLQVATTFNFGLRGRSFCDPEVMSRICVDADVCLCRLDLGRGRSCAHLDWTF